MSKIDDNLITEISENENLITEISENENLISEINNENENLISEISENENKIDIKDVTLLRDEFKRVEDQLHREKNARQELEEMLIKMENLLKSEQESRKQAEEMLEQSVQAEIQAKKELEHIYDIQSSSEKEIVNEREALKTERDTLENMRQEFEEELKAARTEVAKAQDALKTAEDRVRAEERVEMAKMEAEYQKRLTILATELDRVRQELIIRTQILGEEIERWKQQAEVSASAVIEAKTEVLERKRDLDNTREKMDRLMDRLHLTREQGISLHTSLSSALMYQNHSQRTLLTSIDHGVQHALRDALPWGSSVVKSLPSLPESSYQKKLNSSVNNDQGKIKKTNVGFLGGTEKNTNIRRNLKKK